MWSNIVKTTTSKLSTTLNNAFEKDEYDDDEFYDQHQQHEEDQVEDDGWDDDDVNLVLDDVDDDDDAQGEDAAAVGEGGEETTNTGEYDDAYDDQYEDNAPPAVSTPLSQAVGAGLMGLRRFGQFVEVVARAGTKGDDDDDDDEDEDAMDDHMDGDGDEDGQYLDDDQGHDLADQGQAMHDQHIFHQNQTQQQLTVSEGWNDDANLSAVLMEAEEENVWNADDDLGELSNVDLNANELHLHDQQLQQQPTQPPAQNNLQQHQQQESQSNAWGDDDDLDLADISEHPNESQNQSDPLSILATAAAATPTSTVNQVQIRTPQVQTKHEPLPSLAQTPFSTFHETPNDLEGSASAWNDDIDQADLDFDNEPPPPPPSQAQSTPVAETPLKLSPPFFSPSPPNGTPLEIAQARETMQTVLQEIDEQENLAATRSAGTTTPDQEDSRDYLSEEENQAIGSLQQELELAGNMSVPNTPRTRPHAVRSADSPPSDFNIQFDIQPRPIMVDSTPPSRRTITSTPQTGLRGESSLAPGTGDASLAALAASEDMSRDTGRIDDCDVDIHDEQGIYDDENEFDFGPVVDHTPRRMMAKAGAQGGSGVRPDRVSRRTSRSDSVAVQVPRKVEKGWDEEDDINLDGDDDDDDDDGGNEDDDDDASDTLGSTLGSTGVSAVLEHHPVSSEIATNIPVGESAAGGVVDHTPSDASVRRYHRERKLVGIASVQVLASEPGSLRAPDEPDDEEDEENIALYGPVVDHTPLDVDVGFGIAGDVDSTTDGASASGAPGGTARAHRSSITARSVANSMAVNALMLEEDYKIDEAMMEDYVDGDDETTCFGESTIAENTVDQAITGWEEELDVDVEQHDNDAEEDDDDDDARTGDAIIIKRKEDGADESASGDGLPIRRAKKTRGGAAGSLKKGKVVIVRAPRIKFSCTPVHVVDHTPSEIGANISSAISVGTRDPSLAVLAAEEDIERDADDDPNDEEVYEDENEIEFGPVVDHTPSTPATRQAISTTNSLEVNAFELEEEFREDDAMDETAHGDSTIGDSTWNRDDPTIEDDDASPTKPRGAARHRANASREGGGGASGISGLSTGEGGSDKPTAVIANGVAMVDHTPSDMVGDMMGDESSCPQLCDPSVDVLPSAASSSKVDGDHDSQGEGQVYGPVVDQTPTTPAHSIGNLRSDSVVVQAHDLDTVDETYAMEGDDEEDADSIAHSSKASADNADGDAAVSQRGEEEGDQVVDHIPTRPDSRFCDASTLVAADPSEYMSEVDDMAQEDNFGPVVDLTPPTRPSIVGPGIPSATGSTVAGSTAVFAPPSVVADDLDPDADEERDQAGDWDGNEEQGIEEAPNPQSGNDEPVVPNRVNEQLVDFLPPPNEVPVQVRTEEASEMTVGGAQSLIQALDPKEDDFGPVVDQTPTMRSSVAASALSQASTATQLSTTECRALGKDDDAEGASDDADERKEKVVVDNLPSQMRYKARNVDSNCSIGESQLAEDEEEDDSKFGPVVDHLPTPRASLAPSRGGSTVDALATVSEVNSVDDQGDGWDDDADIDVSESGVSDGTALQTAAATRLAIRRAAAADAGAIEHERNVSVRFDESVVDEANSSNRLAAGAVAQLYDPESCASETRFYYQNTYSTNNAYDVEMGKFPSPSNTGADNDNNSKDNDNEIPEASFADADTPPSTPYRRSAAGLTLPEPADMLTLPPSAAAAATPKTFSSMKFQCGACMASETSECPCIRRLLDNNNDTDDGLVGTLRTPEEAKALRLKIEAHKRDESALAKKMEDLESELSKVTTEKGKLIEQASDMGFQQRNLIQEKESLKKELETTKANLGTAEKRVAELINLESALKTEIRSLQSALDDSAAHHASEADMAKQLVTLKKEAASKNGECDDLQKQVHKLDERLNDADSKRCAYLQELESLKVKFEHTTKIYEEQRVTALQQTSERRLLEQVREELTSKLGVVTKAKDEAEQSVIKLQNQHEAELKRQYQLIDKKSEEIRSFENSLKALETEKASLIAEVEKQRVMAEKSERLAKELLSVAKERDLLHEALTESKEAVQSLETNLGEYSKGLTNFETSHNEEIKALKADLENAKSALETKTSEVEKLAKEVDELTKQKSSLLAELESMRSTVKSLEESSKATKAALVKEKESSAAVQKEMQTTQAELSKTKADLEHSESERKKSTHHLATLGRKLEKTDKESSGNREKIQELEAKLAKSSNDLKVSGAEKVKLLADLTALESKYIEVKTQSDNFHKEAEARYGALQKDSELGITKQKKENQALLSEISDFKKQTGAFAEERGRLLQKLQQSEQQSSAALEQAKKQYEQLKKKQETEAVEHKARQNDLLQELNLLKKNVEALSKERETLALKCQEIETVSNWRVKEAESKVTQAELIRQEEREQSKFVASELEGKKAELEAAANELSNARQQLTDTLNERDALQEENEEMLVQFGLLNEQMGISEQNVALLQAEVEAHQGVEGEASEQARQIVELSQQNTKLLAELEHVSSEKASLQSQLRAMEERSVFLETELIELGARCSNFEQQSEELERAKDQMNSQEGRCVELEQISAQREVQIQELNNKLDQSESVVATLSAMRDQLHIMRLERDAKNGELQNMQDRFSAAEEEIIELRRIVNAKKMNSSEHDNRLRELQERCSTAEEQLSFAKDQLAAAEATISAEQNLVSCANAIRDLELNDDSQRVDDLVAEFEMRMEELQTDLSAKSQLIGTLEENITQLKSDLDASRRKLKKQKETSQTNGEEVSNLKTQIESLNDALHSTRERLATREEEIDRLAAEVNRLQSSPPPERPKQSETQDEIDNLRASVVSLAMALERSENLRAEAFDRLLKEREANAESLRRLSESVKRFYSSISAT